MEFDETREQLLAAGFRLFGTYSDGTRRWLAPGGEVSMGERDAVRLMKSGKHRLPLDVEQLAER